MKNQLAVQKAQKQQNNNLSYNGAHSSFYTQSFQAAFMNKKMFTLN